MLKQSVVIGLMLVCLGCSGGGTDTPIPTPHSVDPPVNTPPPTTEPPPVTVPPVVTPPVTPPPVITPPPVVVPPPVLQSPAGIWHGQTARDGRLTLGVVLDDGRAWFVMSLPGAPEWAAGTLLGTIKSTQDHHWSMKDATMVQRDFQQRSTVQVKGTWTDRQRMVGALDVNYYDVAHPLPPLYPTDAVDLIYDTRSDIPFSLDRVAGTYTGLFMPLEEVEVILSQDGTFHGRSATGCLFHGTVTPHGPAAEIVFEFGDAPCTSSGLSSNGILWVDEQTHTLTMAGFALERNQGIQGLLLIATR